MSDERQKKIEAGKLKLAEFQKKKHKNAKSRTLSENSRKSSSFECPSIKSDDISETTDSSSNSSINTMKEKSDISHEQAPTECSGAGESAFQISEEEVDDADTLLDGKQTDLVSCLEQKIEKYQDASKQKDSMIQQLSEQLASAMNAKEASDLARIEVEENLTAEINSFRLQMKETAEMIEKQKSKADNKEIGQGEYQGPCVSETGVQVDILSENNFRNELHGSGLKYFHASETVNGIKDANKGQSSLQSNFSSDVSSMSKKISSLSVIAKFIESHVNISSQCINEINDFSPSKFQMKFLRRLNSVDNEAAPGEASENEGQVSDVDEESASFVKNESDYHSIEKLRSSVVPKDFSTVTEFLLHEMETINSSLMSIRAGPQGDNDGIAVSIEPTLLSQGISMKEKTLVDSDLMKVLQQKSRLEAKVMQLKQLGQQLQDGALRKESVESDTLAISDDNLIMDEPALSCISLVSLSDGEYRTEGIATDSEANFSRKVSIDSSRPLQDGDFCSKCDKYFELINDKYDDHLCHLQEAIENNVTFEKNDAIKRLELESEKLKLEKEEMKKQIELMCKEKKSKIQHLISEHQEQLNQLQNYHSKCSFEKDQLILNIEDLEGKLTQANKELTEAWNEKFSLQNQMADLVEEHQEDLDARNLANSEQFSQERKKLELEYSSSIGNLKKLHGEEINNLKKCFDKELEERETCLREEHSNAINVIEVAHSEECTTYQKKIEQLLDEKCELLSNTTKEYETILKKNHKVLVTLCNQLRSKLFNHKKKISDESCRSGNSDLEVNVTDAFEELNKSIEDGIVRFLDRNYFATNGHHEMFDDTQYLSLEIKSPVYDADFFKDDAKPLKKKQDLVNVEKQHEESESVTCLSDTAPFEGSQERDSLVSLTSENEETAKCQVEFQNNVALYMEVNQQLRAELQILQGQIEELKCHKKEADLQLHEKEKELALKESQLATMDSGSVKGGLAGSQLSSSDIRDWQVADVAQTNSRLLNVLSDLVKEFLDIEQEIYRHLHEHGLIDSRSGALGQHDEETGHSVGSREDFASLSFGECPNIELAEDGPDLTPRAWDICSAVGTYDKETEGEDVVLGASRRLRMTVDHLLKALSRALDNQQNPDIKLLLKRNQELSQELQEVHKESIAMHMKFMTADSSNRKLNGEKKILHDVISDFKESHEILKREINNEKYKVAHLTREKEAASDEIDTLRNQCELLASRLGDPEKVGANKTLSSPVSHVYEKPELLQENSRLSSEKHNVQICLGEERQSFADRMQQMEIALEDITAEKEELMEKKCKEIRDLKAEMEAMEKQLQSNKKFIEEQAQEREQEREDYLKELNKMQEMVREKEKIQSNEEQLMKDIEALEQLLQARIEDHQNSMQKKDLVENDLRQSVEQIRDLRDVIEELEKQLNVKSKTEMELRQKLSSLSETMNAQEKRNSLLDEEIALSRNTAPSGDSTEHVKDLKEKLACQTKEIEEMSQNQTLLHELRGQIHFLEAKVEQRAKQLEALHLSSNSPVQSADASPSSSQESESLHLPCEDGWEMSPRSIHWLEVRRLEEKIGRLVHIDEELIKRNKELEHNLKKLQHIHSECEQENSVLQEKLTEQLMQVSALKSHIDEQKHRCVTPHKSQPGNKKMEEIKVAYEALLENNKHILSELHEKCSAYDSLREEMEEKNYLIVTLQRSNHAAVKQKDEENTQSLAKSSDCFKLLVLEKDEELKSKIQLIELLRQQQDELQINATELSVALEKLQNELEHKSEELTDMSYEKKRLEEDLDQLQNMMQQKETELVTLHEETDAQMKLEADMETLEREIQHRRGIEEMLRQELHQLEAALEASKIVHRQDSENWQLQMRDLEEAYQLEVENLKKQIEIFRNSYDDSPEDIDLAAIRNKIMEAVNGFSLIDSKDIQKYEKLVYSLLKKAVDMKLKHLKKKHEVDISTINQSWQQKVAAEYEHKNELESQCKKYKTDFLMLQERLKDESDKLDTDKDDYWQSKMSNVESSLKEKHNRELSFFKSNIEQLSKEKASAEMEVKSSACKIVQLSEDMKVQREKLLKEFQAKMSAIEQKFNEKFNAKLQEAETREKVLKEFQAKMSVIEQKLNEKFKAKLQESEKIFNDRLLTVQQKLNIAEEKEKYLESKHKEEIADLHNIYATRWNNEMRKVVASRKEENEKFNSKEKDFDALRIRLLAEYGERLTNLQKKCALQIAEERRLSEMRHKADLQEVRQTLEKEFEGENRTTLLTKDKELIALSDILEEKKKEIEFYKSEMLRNENTQRELISQHEKQIKDLKQKLHDKYKKRLQDQLQARDAEIRSMEETCNQRIEEVSEMVKAAKRAATGSLHSDSGSNRTTTPSSEITSSDEACSSCQEDMLHKHILVDKIHQDGKRILNFIESSRIPSADEKKARAWLDERDWITDKLKCLNSGVVQKQGNLKLNIENLCDELLETRQKIRSRDDEISFLRRKCIDLELEISNEDYGQNSRNNVSQLKRTPEETRFSLPASTPSNHSHKIAENSNFSYDIGILRSADSPKSAEKFSMFLPEIDNSSLVKLNKTTEELSSESVKSRLQLTGEIAPPPCDMKELNNMHSSIQQELQSMLGRENTAYEVKMHGMYWMYKKTMSYNKSLIYQKKYLLMLLKGFQLTEKVTLSYVNQMNTNLAVGHEICTSSITTDCPLRGRALFRSVAYAAIAIQRMKYLVRKWRILARVPTEEVVIAEVHSLLPGCASNSPTLTPSGFNLSFLSLSASVCENDQLRFGLHSSSSSMSSRTGTKPKRESKPSPGQLEEYVHRLSSLQKKLGLENFR